MWCATSAAAGRGSRRARLDHVGDEDLPRSSPASASSSSSSFPARPTNGRPCSSSLAPGRLADDHHVRIRGRPRRAPCWVAVSHGSNPHPPCVRISAWRASSSGRELACITSHPDAHVRAVRDRRTGGVRKAVSRRRSRCRTAGSPRASRPGSGTSSSPDRAPTGGIFSGNLKTGQGRCSCRAAARATGMKVDHRNRLFVSGAGDRPGARVRRAAPASCVRQYTLDVRRRRSSTT